MPGGNNRGPLPGHLAVGRGDYSGPMIGGQLLFMAYIPTLTSATEILAPGWIAPCEMTLQAALDYVRDITVGGATTWTWTLYKHPTAFQTSGATAITAAITQTTNASGRVITTTTSDDIASSGVLIRSARQIARGDRVFFGMSTNAGTISDITVGLVFTTRGRSSANTVDD